MKKWLGILGVLMILAGCQDSTSDVAVVGRESTLPPDTVLTNDGVTVEIYRPGHPKTMPYHDALLTQIADQQELNRLLEMGYILAPAGPTVAHGVAADGRIVDVTWFSATDRSGSEGAIVHVRMGQEESIHVLRGPARGDDVDPDVIDKAGVGPARSLGRDCFDAAKNLYQACVANCVKDGGNPVRCRSICFVGAVFFFVYCLFTSL